MKKIIAAIIALILIICANCVAEPNPTYDFVLGDNKSCVWICDINSEYAKICIDYPTSGVIQDQNVYLEVNDIRTVTLWHGKETTSATFNVSYSEGELFVYGVCDCEQLNGYNAIAVIQGHSDEEILWCALIGNVIPKGTRVRVWSECYG